MRKIFWVTIFVLLSAGQSVRAENTDANDPNKILKTRHDFVIADSNDPNELLMNAWGAITNILCAKDIDEAVKEKVIDKVTSPFFDFELMGKLTLGRKYWPKLTEAESEKFILLFTERLKKSYRKKIMLYENEKAELLTAVKSGKTVQVPMQLMTKDQKIIIVYKFRMQENHWKIYDVEIQGVSILLTYRSQFEDILQNGSVNDLLKLLGKSEPN